MYSYPIRNQFRGEQFIPENDEDRFFWAPFVVGGLAGTALGYGIANNNQMNHGYYPTPYYPPYPMYVYPTQTTYYF